MAESRKHPRLTVHPPVAFQIKGAPRLEAECRDVSLGGMFICTDQPAPFAAEIIVYLVLPGLKAEIAIPSVVRWTKPNGMGVQFGVMGARETYALTELLSGN